MSNLGKKWGTVIACWAVALVLVIAGICMGLVIPSSADSESEGNIAVMFDADGDGKYSEEETTIYHTLQEAFTAVNDFEPTVEKSLTIQLRSNVTSIGVTGAVFKDYTLDLNGYILSFGSIGIMQIINYDNVVKIIDSRPDVAHYFAYVGKGEYEYTDESYMVGFNTQINGGVMIGAIYWPGMFVTATEKSESQLVIDGGTYMGGMFFGTVGTEEFDAEIVINQGVNLRCGADLNIWELDEPVDCAVSIMSQGNSKLKINGGNIYGKIIEAFFDEGGSNMVDYNYIDLTDKASLPEWVEIDSKIKFVEKEIDGETVYVAVDAETEEPIDQPSTKAEPANDNNNMIALIVLGAAAAVMVVGVTTIVIINNKRRKKVA